MTLSAILYCAMSITATDCREWRSEEVAHASPAECHAHIAARRAEIEANLALEGRTIWWGRDGRMATFACVSEAARLPEPGWFRSRRAVPIVPFRTEGRDA